MSVAVNKLTKIFGAQKAVNEISFEVNQGEILGFLGPNGAGKTTTMKMLTCFLPQTSGEATVCGFDVTKNPMDVRQKIGYLPEHNPLYKEMYVREYLEFVGRLHGIKKLSNRVGEMIELTGLQREQKKRIAALSKGYRQRVGLAQAMIHNPEVLILDEPTSGLDPNQLVEIRNLIKSMGEEKTVIFSTHIMQEVQAICDRVLIINKGNLVANDTIEQLQQKVSGKKVILVTFDKVVSPEQVEKIKGIEEVVSRSSKTMEIISKVDVRGEIFDFAVKNELKLLELTPVVSTVEDVFQQLTMAKN